jgi:hypothetical protein
MEINVALPTANHAHGLVQRLAGALEATVSLEADRHEIHVRADTDSHGAILRIVNIVEDWLEQGGVDSARLSLGDRSYQLVGNGQTASFG